MRTSISTLIFVLFITFSAGAQRQVKNLNSGWNFKLEKTGKSELVNIPHTWNAEDAFTEKEYHRGLGIYEKELFVPKAWKEKSVFLKFEGANQLTSVFVNDKLVGSHIGGYTSFIFELSPQLDFGKVNKIRIEVDNSHNQDIPPLEADFNFYGGIYRDLQLIITGKDHFKLEGPAAGTLPVKTPSVSEELAEVNFSGEIIRKGNKDKLGLNITIFDPAGRRLKSVTEKVGKDSNNRFSLNFKIEKPLLWSPDNPQLYELRAELVNKRTREVSDIYSTKFGLRWFEADPEKGFFLNGKPIKLIGANRHQDFENMGNAVPNSIHLKDYKMIKDMGANFIRTAHYPQDPDVYRICDELGLLVWTEIPVINDVTDSEAYHNNSLFMQEEQVRQLFNHPSIVFWGYMNEIFIRLVFTRDMSEADKNAKIRTSVELAWKLEKKTKQLDSSRLSVMALHENDIYNTSGIADIPDVIGWNLYFGWYTKGLENLGKFLDAQHEKYPNRPILISEYGPGSDSRIQTNDPKPWNFSEAYQLKSHVSYLNQVMEREYMLGMAAWNFADFGSSGRQDSRPFINQKGLVNFNREPKDVYYYYKAKLADEDFVYIAGRNYETRLVNENEKVKVKVFSNSETVELQVNDDQIFNSPVHNNIAEFELGLPAGSYTLKATSGNAQFIREIKVIARNSLLEKIKKEPIRINVGSHGDFIDEETGEIWISDQAYKENSFGYSGGKPYQQSPDKFQGSASDIKLTNNEPLYQTMREGLDSYKFDVPAGKYRISLLFTEPNRRASVENIYNLGSDQVKASEEIRSFDILINGRLVEEDLNLARDFGILQAVELTYEIRPEDKLEIRFRSQSGQPVLSGLKLESL